METADCCVVADAEVNTAALTADLELILGDRNTLAVLGAGQGTIVCSAAQNSCGVAVAAEDSCITGASAKDSCSGLRLAAVVITAAHRSSAIAAGCRTGSCRKTAARIGIRSVVNRFLCLLAGFKNKKHYKKDNDCCDNGDDGRKRKAGLLLMRLHITLSLDQIVFRIINLTLISCSIIEDFLSVFFCLIKAVHIGLFILAGISRSC